MQQTEFHHVYDVPDGTQPKPFLYYPIACPPVVLCRSRRIQAHSYCGCGLRAAPSCRTGVCSY